MDKNSPIDQSSEISSAEITSEKSVVPPNPICICDLEVDADSFSSRIQTVQLIQWDIPRTFPTLSFFHGGKSYDFEFV